MKSARVLSPLLLCAGLGLAASAHAENEGWYAVVFAGEASVDSLNQNELDSIFNPPESSLDDSDTGFGASVGYQVTQNFAAELSYVDLGEATYSATDGTDSLSLEASAQGPVFSVLGIIPIGERFAVYGRAGIALLDTEGTIVQTVGNVSTSDSASTQRSNGVYGLGGQYDITERFGIRLAWDRYADVGSADITGEGDIDLFTLGLRINFR